MFTPRCVLTHGHVCLYTAAALTAAQNQELRDQGQDRRYLMLTACPSACSIWFSPAVIMSVPRPNVSIAFMWATVPERHCEGARVGLVACTCVLRQANCVYLFHLHSYFLSTEDLPRRRQLYR